MTTWTADSSTPTVDAGYPYTADQNGASIVSPNAAPYQSLITSEHNTKPNFMALVGTLTGAVADATQAIGNIQPAFNLQTAVGAQLDILGLWIGQSRIVPYVLIPGFFGFSELGSVPLPPTVYPANPFGSLADASLGGEWYNLGELVSGTSVLNDAQYRTVLSARITRNQSNGTASAITEALQFIFGVPCAIVDYGTLSIALLIRAPITPTDEALLTSLDILPRPAGIAIGSITYSP